MDERLSIPMYGGETEYTYVWRRDEVYLCMEERLCIPMYGGETEYTYVWRRDEVYLCMEERLCIPLSSIHRYTQSLLHA
jgi:hypothetical protein